MNDKEKLKVDLFHQWLVNYNPGIGTCVELMRAIEAFIDYKLTTLKILEDSKEAMDYGRDFAQIMSKNFPEATDAKN